MTSRRRDVGASAAAAFIFSFAIGLASVALPLLALASGYSPTQVGLFVALSAASQMTSRLALGRVMRIYSDWVLVAASSLALALCCAVAALSAAVVSLAIAQVLQGVARACFWTGSQTHAIRGGGSAVRALATVNLIGSIGQVLGPVAAGVIAEPGVRLALVVGSITALGALVPALCLDRLPPFTLPPERPPGQLWRREGVTAGVWAGASAGAWRGLVDSYVPVALVAARQSSSTVGVLVGIANAASMIGTVLVARASPRGLLVTMTLGSLTCGCALAVFGLGAGWLPLAAVTLVVSGLGAGALQTLGPAISSSAVHPEERGEAIASVGTFRSGAGFLAPAGVAVMVTVAPLSIAFVIAGLAMAIPSFRVTRRRQSPDS